MECQFCKKVCRMIRDGSDIAIFRCDNCEGYCNIVFVREARILNANTIIFTFEENNRSWILCLDPVENTTRLSYISLLDKEEDRENKFMFSLPYVMKDVTPQNVQKTVKRLNSMVAFS